MSDSPSDPAFWEQRWSEALEKHGDRIAEMPPSPYLLELAADLEPGRALDAGCGHGAESLWLAAHGWQVTAVDFSDTALARARRTAEAMGDDIAARVEWVHADLGTWTPEPETYELVLSLHVHVAGSVDEMVTRLAGGVAPGGTIVLVGHLPTDPLTGESTPAVGQTQVTVDVSVPVLDNDRWELVAAETRPRTTAGTGFDAVIDARRRERA